MKRQPWFRSAWHLAVAGCLLAGCDRSASEPQKAAPPPRATAASAPKTPRKPDVSPLVTAARSQIGRTLAYDPAYVALAYPGGDVPIEKGVCTDVVIRALRDAIGMDLQRRVHEDMKAAFSQYPTIWGLSRPDRNIDHRRVPNLRTYFERSGCSVGVTQEAEDYLPGDLVACTVGGNRPHIMIVSDRRTADDVPFVIHNIGRGTVEENRLFDFPITGHYRIKHGTSSDSAVDSE